MDSRRVFTVDEKHLKKSLQYNKWMNSLLLSILVGIILLGGISSGDAQSEVTIIAKTDKTVYFEGDKVTVSGNIKNFDPEIHSAIDVTYRVTDPEGSIVSLGQTRPTSNGSFTFGFDIGGGFFQQNGNYPVHLFFESAKKEISFSFKKESPSPLPEKNTINPDQKIITITMDGPSIFYLNVPNQIIRALVEIQNYSPSDGKHYMKVIHLPTEKVLKNSEIYPKSSGNDLWSVQIAYPLLETDLKFGSQALTGEFEINISSEFDPLTANTLFLILESRSSPSFDKNQESVIPEWIRNNAKWWVQGGISDSEFVSGIQYLIKEEIMIIPDTKATQTSSPKTIPEWVKNNADWWSQGLISDDDFVKGIQYLIANGIMIV